ncbi:AAA family ATPase [Nocardia sp. NPDC005978]|uniref:nucleotide-binding protein n=1 Tax=Nocardia sp. NPDC005978 TaxID=3156725 RepID=UPI0033AF7E6F
MDGLGGSESSHRAPQRDDSWPPPGNETPGGDTNGPRVNPAAGGQGQAAQPFAPAAQQQPPFAPGQRPPAGGAQGFPGAPQQPHYADPTTVYGQAPQGGQGAGFGTPQQGPWQQPHGGPQQAGAPGPNSGPATGEWQPPGFEQGGPHAGATQQAGWAQQPGGQDSAGGAQWQQPGINPGQANWANPGNPAGQNLSGEPLGQGPSAEPVGGQVADSGQQPHLGGAAQAGHGAPHGQPSYGPGAPGQPNGPQQFAPGQYGPDASGPQGNSPQYGQAAPGGPASYGPGPSGAYGPGQGQQYPAPGAPLQYGSAQPPPSLDNVPLRRAKKAPGSGWRKAVHHVSGGAINPGLSAEERRLQELVARIRQPVRGDYRIAVLSLKGGVGKTTTTMGLGAIFSSIRGDRVIAVDANPDFGTLSQRVALQTRSTVRDLLLDPSITRYSDVRRHTSQASSRLEVLASERDPAASEAFSEDEYRSVARILQRFYNIILTDCGTGLMHSAMAGVLDLAHSLVLISSSAIDGARSAAATLDWLSLHGHDHLVRNAVVVINLPRPGAKTVGINQLRDYFLSRCRAVHIIPYDGHLGEGAEIDLARLTKDTKRAYVELAATVADDFATDHRRHG